MPTWAIILIIAAAVIIIGIIWYISTKNKFVKLGTACDEGFSTIDVYLKKRYDLIPNLVETVKGYAKHESATLENVIKARNAAVSATGDAKVEAENQLQGTLKSLFALAESYPDLKADSQFLNLQNQLHAIEQDLSQARKYYNATVKSYNVYLQMFPSSIVASLMKLEKRAFFEVSDPSERQNVKVSF